MTTTAKKMMGNDDDATNPYQRVEFDNERKILRRIHNIQSNNMYTDDRLLRKATSAETSTKASALELIELNHGNLKAMLYKIELCI